MNFYIKEWPDNTATLMTEYGRVVWTFTSVEEAEEAAGNCDWARERQNRNPVKCVLASALSRKN